MCNYVQGDVGGCCEQIVICTVCAGLSTTVWGWVVAKSSGRCERVWVDKARSVRDCNTKSQYIYDRQHWNNLDTGTGGIGAKFQVVLVVEEVALLFTESGNAMTGGFIQKVQTNLVALLC